MTMYTGKKLGSPYSYESIIVFRAGMTVWIDRTQIARTRCIGRGMKARYMVTADNGEKFTVYSGIVESVLGGKIPAACAIPD